MDETESTLPADREVDISIDSVPDAPALARSFAEMAHVMLVPGSLSRTRHQIVQQALLAVGGDHAAMLVLGADGQVRVKAGTSVVVSEAGAVERRTEEGPAHDVLLHGGSLRVGDASTDSRWPRFGDWAAKMGVRGVLACELSTDRRRLGVLCMYAEQPDAFTEQSEELACVYAAHASLVLDSVRVETELTDALKTRQVIGEAVGILVERHRVTSQQAFEMLVRASKNRNIKIRDLADLLVETGADPGSAPVPAHLTIRAVDRRPTTDATSGAASGEPRLHPLDDGRLGFTVSGEVDLSNWDELQAALDTMPPSRDDITLDLAGLEFIDVASVRALLRSADKLNVEGRGLVLNRPPAVLRRILGVFVGQEIAPGDAVVLPWRQTEGAS